MPKEQKKKGLGKSEKARKAWLQGELARLGPMQQHKFAQARQRWLERKQRENQEAKEYAEALALHEAEQQVAAEHAEAQRRLEEKQKEIEDAARRLEEKQREIDKARAAEQLEYEEKLEQDRRIITNRWQAEMNRQAQLDREFWNVYLPVYNAPTTTTFSVADSLLSQLTLTTV
jgi:NADH dehydrogenase/NADH:ubiquinone oxidoreductase subunit G